MNIMEKKNELINLVLRYLKNQATLLDLQNFSWEVIEYFTREKKNKLSAPQQSEKEFWYAIWQIQHLADEEHEKEGITKTVLTGALDYLMNKKKIPDNCNGTRP